MSPQKSKAKFVLALIAIFVYLNILMALTGCSHLLINTIDECPELPGYVECFYKDYPEYNKRKVRQ